MGEGAYVCQSVKLVSAWKMIICTLYNCTILEVTLVLYRRTADSAYFVSLSEEIAK